MTVATARRLADEGVHVAALGLICPWTDPSDSDMPRRARGTDREWGKAAATMYRGDAAHDASRHHARDLHDGHPCDIALYADHAALVDLGRVGVVRGDELAPRWGNPAEDKMVPQNFVNHRSFR